MMLQLQQPPLPPQQPQLVGEVMNSKIYPKMASSSAFLEDGEVQMVVEVRSQMMRLKKRYSLAMDDLHYRPLQQRPGQDLGLASNHLTEETPHESNAMRASCLTRSRVFAVYLHHRVS
jgi:hypothetical protein